MGAPLLRISLRNVLRNKRRSAITIGSAAFALALMIPYTALMDGFMNTMEHNAVALDLAHVQIHNEDYRAERSIYETVDEALVPAVEAQGLQAAGRLFAWGLAALGEESAGVALRALDVEQEKDVTTLHSHVMKGEWLSPADVTGVVLGRRLARRLTAEIGSEIVVLTQAADGSMGNELYIVRGILKTAGEEIDRAGVFMTEAAWRNLLALDNGYHEIAITRPVGMSLEGAKALALGAVSGVEVQTWKELRPSLSEIIETSKSGVYILFIIVYAALAILMINAMLMAVFERIKEVGLMKSLGMRPNAVMRMVIYEMLAQTLGAALLGILFGSPLAYYFERYGVDFSSFGDSTSISGVAIDTHWFAIFGVNSVVSPVIFLFLVVMLVSIYPAAKAALINPIEALQHS